MIEEEGLEGAHGDGDRPAGVDGHFDGECGETREWRSESTLRRMYTRRRDEWNVEDW